MRKKILILGHNDATQFIDIFNQYTQLFDKTRYEVTVAYLTGEPNQTTLDRTLAEKVLFLNIPKKKIRTLKIAAIKRLYQLCRQQQFDIIICHRYKPTYIMLWVSRFLSIPALICVMHELGTMSAFSRQLLIAGLIKKNVILAGVSNAVRDDIRKSLWFLSAERIITLYNMLDVDATALAQLSREKARQDLHLANNDFIFGHIARLAPNKDQQTLIQAFAQIKPHCPTAKLIIMGEGELAETLKQQIKSLGICQDVILTGFMPNAFQYMKAFDSFVLPSIQEAFGRVLIEAMVAKLPIIASRVHGIPEVMGDIGQLVNPRDCEGLAKAMRCHYELNSLEREQQGEKVYQHVVQHFSIPAFQQQFWSLPLIQTLGNL